jgi:DNA-binding IclR family transcriptional regulator
MMLKPAEHGSVLSDRCWNLPLKPTHKLVLLALLACIGRDDDSPSVADLASMTGHGAATVRTALAELRAAGVVQVALRPGFTSEYALTPSRLRVFGRARNSLRSEMVRPG